jgi:hypothetical protein
LWFVAVAPAAQQQGEAGGDDVRKAQEFLDQAARQTQQGSDIEARKAARMVNEAFDRAVASTNDSRLKQAIRNLQAQFWQEVNSGRTWTPYTGRTEGSRGEASNWTGEVRWSVNLDREIGQALIDHYGGVMNMLRARTNNPREFNQTAQRIAQEVAQRYKAAPQDGMRSVTPPEDVGERGVRNVRPLYNRGQGQLP